MRQILFGTGIFSLGLSITPLIGMISAMNPAIVPTALGLTLAIFGGASLVAYNMPKGAMLSYGKILGGSLFGLIGLQLVGLGSLFFTGPNPFAYMLLNASTYVSAGLFTIFVAYDTHLAVRMYEQNMPDSLGLAVNFVLDFWNIFVSILRMLSNQDK
jgi:FtsH-binding integral membrane protein